MSRMSCDARFVMVLLKAVQHCINSELRFLPKRCVIEDVSVICTINCRLQLRYHSNALRAVCLIECTIVFQILLLAKRLLPSTSVLRQG